MVLGWVLTRRAEPTGGQSQPPRTRRTRGRTAEDWQGDSLELVLALGQCREPLRANPLCESVMTPQRHVLSKSQDSKPYLLHPEEAAGHAMRHRIKRR